VLSGDLAAQTADLLAVAGTSEPRALDRLVTVAATQVAACGGAEAGLWRDGELIVLAASHPDLAGLTEVQRAAGRGPVLVAMTGDGPVSCPDTLADERWPEYAAAALLAGVRCSVTLAHRAGGMAVTLSLAGARPRAIDPDQLPLAGLLVALGGAMIGNATDYGDSRRTALQLLDAAESRELVDQAKGMLMHALGCSAADALKRMREVSQQRNIKVTDVAARIVESRGAGL
jgi:ANTAR domain-containing protein